MLMKHPIKKNEIYQKLKKAIDDGIHPGGSFLPNETALAQIMGISRNTLRSVLTQLAEEKVIERMYPKGTMVCARRGNIQQPLTFLLPCADFLSETFPHVAAQSTRMMLKGVSQIAFENNYRVETVPVSPTNNAHEIDWRKLDFVNADSRLVVTTYWYRELFPLLLERGCRVAFVNQQTFYSKNYEDFIKSCFRITINDFGAAEAAVEYLFRRGCRRIALFQRYISEPEHPLMGGYLAGLKKCGLKFSAWHELPEQPLKQENVKSRLKDLYNQSGGFDSLLIGPEIAVELRLHNLYQSLGLPENIKIIVSDDAGNNQWTTLPLTGMAFPCEELGRIAARHLLSPEFLPGEQLINARIIERESTSVHKSDFTLA